MRIALAILFLFVQIACASFTNVVPANRHIVGYWGPQWQGVQWPYLTNRTLYTNMIGLDGTDTTDVASTIQAALDNAGTAKTPPNVYIVRLPAGTYKCGSSLTISAGTALQGDTNGGTVLHFTGGSSPCVDLGVDSNDATAFLFSGYNYGSSNIVVATNLDSLGQAFNVGDFVFCTATNDTNFIMEISSFAFQGQVGTDMGFTAKITAVNNVTNLSIWPPILWNFKTSLGPQLVHWPAVRTNLGVEDLTINMKDVPSITQGVWMQQTYGGWCRNVVVTNSAHLGIQIDKCLQSEVVGCATDTIGAGAANSGVGIESFKATCWSKVENNRCTWCFQGIQFDYRCSANAFLYNWVGHGSNTSTSVAADINGNHGCGNIYSLFEGNKCSHFQLDPTHGSAGNITAFRNHFLARIQGGVQKNNTQLSTAVSINIYHYSNNIVGNVLGDPEFPLSGGNGKYIVETNTPLTVGCIYSFGLPNQGNRDWNAVMPPAYAGNALDNFVNTNGSDGLWTTIYKYNLVMPSNTVAAVESIGTTNIEQSLFYPSKPSWYSNFVWPPFGPDVVNYTNVLPAEARWYGLAQPSGGAINTSGKLRGIRMRQ